jgi:hypothetical protein
MILLVGAALGACVAFFVVLRNHEKRLRRLEGY